MSDDPRILELLQIALESDRTPDDICGDSPDLLPEVRRRWENCRLLQDQIDQLFPSSSGDVGIRGAVEPLTTLPQIDGYRVDAILGRGGMGVVYRARHLRLRRTVALKMLLSGAYASGLERARFLREAQAIASLRDPHVVQVYDIGEHDGRPFFTMELLEGGNLAQRLAGFPRPAAEAAGLLADLASAVEAAHRQGVVHRDLKPANVLLTTEGTAKISDFGLAHLSEADDSAITLSGARMGTPSYMAPEQASGSRQDVGVATDVYALGAILYEVLTGRPPFRGESAAETERQVIADDPVPPTRLNPCVPRDLETICLKCLEKDPHRRYPSAGALSADLQRFARREPILARPVGRLERTAKWARRRPAVATLWVGGTLVTLATCVGVAWWASSRAAAAREIEDLLRQTAVAQREARWAEADASLDRAMLRVGNGAGAAAALRTRVAAARRDSGFVRRLEAIRMTRVNVPGAYGLSFDEARAAYVGIFREAGLGSVGDDPGEVATRLVQSNVRRAFVAALYDWMGCGHDVPRNEWLVAVAQRADPDPTGWRDRALDPATRENPAAAAAVASDPAIASQPVQLLLLVRDRIAAGGQDPVAFLRRVQQTHPADFWANLSLSVEMQNASDYAGGIRYAEALVVLRPQAALSHHVLGCALFGAERYEEAAPEFRQALRLDPNGFVYRAYLGAALSRAGRHEEAVRELEASADKVAMWTLYRGRLCDSLEALGRIDEISRHQRDALGELPRNLWWEAKLRNTLARHGRLEEALANWRVKLDALATPAPAAANRTWEGYAEYCLFIGRPDEYRRACRVLLDRTDLSEPLDWEYVARVCLLEPPDDTNDLERATSLIDRVIASDQVRRSWEYPFAHVTKALAEYRAGRFESAIETVQSNPAKVLGPEPDLILAMAQWQLGQRSESRRSLARAVVWYDWSPGYAAEPEHWIRHALSRSGPRNPIDADPLVYHVLRREAERLILPDLPRYFDGSYEPRDADERLAMTGACENLERHAAHARLWARAYQDDPKLAAVSRGRAVRAAVLAGCGLGSDAGTLSDADRARLRADAREWFEAELAAAATVGPATTSPAKPATTYAELTEQGRALFDLRSWLKSPDFAGVRDEDALARLPAEEARQWGALWERAAKVLGPPKRPTWSIVPPPPSPPPLPLPTTTQKTDLLRLSKKK